MPEAILEEIECKGALLPCSVPAIPSARWSLDPYRNRRRGVAYDRPHDQAHRARSKRPDADRRVLVRTNIVTVLRRELRRRGWTQELVAIGAAGDPYQPAELRYGLTRGALKAFRDCASPCAIVTKSPLVLRDLPLLLEISGVTECMVLVTLPTLREEICRHIEPEEADPALRLDAVSRLAGAGIRCGVMLAPVIAGLTDDEEGTQAVAVAARERGATFVASAAVARQPGAAPSPMPSPSRPIVQLSLAI